MKMRSIVRSCVGPSPTTDDDPSTSGGRRGSSRSGAAPDGLTSRNRSSDTQEGQPPRKGMLTKVRKSVMNAPHAIAVRAGISQSRTAAAAAAASSSTPPEHAHQLVPGQPPVTTSGGGAPHATAGSQVPPWQPTQAGPVPVRTVEVPSQTLQPPPDTQIPPQPHHAGSGKKLLTKLGKIGKGITNAPHAIAVRTGISQSRTAAAAAAASNSAPPEHVMLADFLGHQLPPDARRRRGTTQGSASSQVPPQSPTQASPPGVNLWAVLDEQARQAQGSQIDRSPHISSLARRQEPPTRTPPVVQQPVAQPTLVEPPLVRHPEVPPENRQLTLDVQTRPQPHHADPGPSIRVEPPVHHETPPVVEPEAQPVVQVTSRRTRVSTSLPRSDSDISIGSLSTISLGNSNRSVRQDPSPPLPWRSREETPPETLVQPESTVAVPPARTDLPSRREAFVTAATQALQQMHLPQAGKVLANASITRELGATANTLLKPLQVAAQTGSTLVQAGASWLNRPRQSSEALQQALGNGEALGRPEFQALAHELAVDYGTHAATVLDTALPMVHSILKIGVAGTAMAFGAGRNTGLAAGDALGRLERGAAQATGVRAGPERAAATLPSGTAFKLMGAGAQQLVTGSLTGAVGNLTGQYLAAPLVNLIPRQFAPIDLRAVLPDETVALMNQLQPGAGDTLRKQVKEAQLDVSTINSASNVRLGQIAFDAITAARFAAQGGLPLGVAGQVGIGLAVSSSAGMVIGAVMASRQSVATQAIPDLPALRQAVEAHAANPGSDGAAALAQVNRNAVPLFFPKQTAAPASPQAPQDLETGHGEPVVVNADAAQRGRLASMRDTAQWAVQQAARPLAVVGQAWGQSLGASPLIEPAAPGTDGAITAGRVLQTASNVAASVVNRAGEMAKATLTTQAWSTASAMLASTTDGPAREVILAMGNAVGIHAAIKPWFDSLVTEIPQGDKKIAAHREQVVNSPAST